MSEAYKLGTHLPQDSKGNSLYLASTTSSGMTNPMTNYGDSIYGGASGAPTRLGIGTVGQVLTVVGGLPAWAAAAGGGGGSSFPVIVQMASGGPSTASLVLPLVPTNGNTLVLVTNSTGGVSAVASANTTWTQVVTRASAGAHYDIWIGKPVAAAGATITITFTGFNSCMAFETPTVVTPTLVQSPAALGTQGVYTRLPGVVVNHLIVLGVGSDSTSGPQNSGFLSVPYIGMGGTGGVNGNVAVYLAIAPRTGDVSASSQSSSTAQAVLAELS